MAVSKKERKPPLPWILGFLLCWSRSNKKDPKKRTVDKQNQALCDSGFLTTPRNLRWYGSSAGSLKPSVHSPCPKGLGSTKFFALFWNPKHSVASTACFAVPLLCQWLKMHWKCELLPACFCTCLNSIKKIIGLLYQPLRVSPMPASSTSSNSAEKPRASKICFSALFSFLVFQIGHRGGCALCWAFLELLLCWGRSEQPDGMGPAARRRENACSKAPNQNWSKQVNPLQSLLYHIDDSSSAKSSSCMKWAVFVTQREPTQSCRSQGPCLGKPCSMCFVLSSGVVFGLQTSLPWYSRVSLSHLWGFGRVDFLWAALFIRASSLKCSRVAMWLPRSWWELPGAQSSQQGVRNDVAGQPEHGSADMLLQGGLKDPANVFLSPLESHETASLDLQGKGEKATCGSVGICHRDEVHFYLFWMQIRQWAT